MTKITIPQKIVILTGFEPVTPGKWSELFTTVIRYRNDKTQTREHEIRTNLILRTESRVAFQSRMKIRIYTFIVLCIRALAVAKMHLDFLQLNSSSLKNNLYNFGGRQK